MVLLKKYLLHMVARFRHTMFRSAWRGSLLMVQTELIHTHYHTVCRNGSPGSSEMPAQFISWDCNNVICKWYFIYTQGCKQEKKKTSHTHTHTWKDTLRSKTNWTPSTPAAQNGQVCEYIHSVPTREHTNKTLTGGMSNFPLCQQWEANQLTEPNLW